MNPTEKNKLTHDFINSIVIIKSMTKSASSFIEKISRPNFDAPAVNQNQVEIFLRSMNIIREQTSKIEKIFEGLIDKK
jgi:hypothetical protein